MSNLSRVLDCIATSGNARYFLADHTRVAALAAAIETPLSPPEVTFLVAIGRHWFTDAEHWPQDRHEAHAALDLYQEN